jgi:hypothetical protein
MQRRTGKLECKLPLFVQGPDEPLARRRHLHLLLVASRKSITTERIQRPKPMLQRGYRRRQLERNISSPIFVQSQPRKAHGLTELR